MRLLLDTVTFVWAMASPERISRAGIAAIKPGSAVLELSAISLAEIAIKQARGKLDLTSRDLRTAVEDLKLRVLSYSAAHAYRLFDLPFHHADPFDRLIIAQALAEGIPVVTSDEKFRLYRGLEVIW